MKGKYWIFSVIVLLLFITSMCVGCRNVTADDFIVTIGDKFVIEESQSKIRQFPFLYEFDGKLLLSYSQHPDANLDYETVDGYQLSNDGGISWSERYEGNYSFFTSMVKLSNGKFLGLHYKYVSARDEHLTEFMNGTSTDGINWEAMESSVFVIDEKDPQVSADKISFHRSIIQLSDNSLIASMYGKFKGDSRYRSFIVSSKDDGITWNYLSTIAYDPDIGSDEGYSEPVLSRMRNGNIICVMRVQMFNEYQFSNAMPLHYSISADEGRSWSQPKMIPVDKNSSAFSVDPDLCLSDSGMLLLTYGRPGCRLLISPDGNGKQWIGPYDIETGKTSGYTGIRQVAENKFLIVGDEGANWAKPAKYVIWGRFITIKSK